MACASDCVPACTRLVTGSRTTLTRLEVLDGLMGGGQVHLQPVDASAAPPRTAASPLVHVLLEIQADGLHVPHDLVGRFLEGEVQALLAAAAGRIDEVRGQAALAGAGRAGDQDRAAAIDALAAQHRVQPRDPGRDPLVATPGASSPSDVIGSTEMPRSSMMNGYSLVPWVDAAVLDDAQAAGRDLLDHAMVQQDHAVGDVLLEAVAGQSVPSPRSPVMTAVTPLSLSQRNSRRSSARRMASLDQAGEQRLDGVQDDALRADRVDGVAQADEQALEVVFAGLLDLAALDADVIEASFLSATRSSRSKPSDRTFLVSSSAVSSKAMKNSGRSPQSRDCRRAASTG